VVDEKVRASDGSITACSTHKTNWICRRSSRYERIRREAVIQNRVSQTIRRERALAAAFGKCHRNAAGFGSDLCLISATWPISSKINGALNEALRPHLIRDFAFEQLSCPLAQIVEISDIVSPVRPLGTLLQGKIIQPQQGLPERSHARPRATLLWLRNRHCTASGLDYDTVGLRCTKRATPM
jgi:hypothetical protein